MKATNGNVEQQALAVKIFHLALRIVIPKDSEATINGAVSFRLLVRPAIMKRSL